MYYFSISDNNRHHLGFMVLMDADDSTELTNKQGYFAIKIATVEDERILNSIIYKTLAKLSNQPMLLWSRKGDFFQLSDTTGKTIGKLQQQFLQIDGQHYMLEDLTGVI